MRGYLMRTGSNKSGFTLIEVLFVVFVLVLTALMYAAIFPYLPAISAC